MKKQNQRDKATFLRQVTGNQDTNPGSLGSTLHTQLLLPSSRDPELFHLMKGTTCFTTQVSAQQS